MIDAFPDIVLHSLHKLTGIIFIHASQFVDEYQKVVFKPFHVLYMMKIPVIDILIIESVDFLHYKKPVSKVFGF